MQIIEGGPSTVYRESGRRLQYCSLKRGLALSEMLAYSESIPTARINVWFLIAERSRMGMDESCRGCWQGSTIDSILYVMVRNVFMFTEAWD